ncbi:S8 family serine peptidase [Kribbella koreensis]|uniref:S8 family serine peptidase n=1 Tax=Kribbella koreensis TaxID=57909 RepID=A0ABN1QZW4_9ACTN
MRSTKPMAALLSAALLTAGVGAAAGATAGTAQRTAAGPLSDPPGGWEVGTQAGGVHRQLTLVTGDRVDVEVRAGVPERVRFLPGAGSGSVSSAGGHLFAVPAGAREAIASGRLDRRLFDVTTLLAELGDDSKSASIPVIVEYSGDQAKARRAGTLLPSLGARAEKVRRGSARDFWKSVDETSAVRRVSLDRKVTAALDWSVPQIGVPAAWKRGLTGKGVKVAVLDTGIDATHPDLRGKVVKAKNFSAADNVTDHYGHGTHVAGTIAGSGAASKGKYRGVAPDATLLNGKVLDDGGDGSESTIIAGMEWAVAQGADIVNMSLGTQDESNGTDPVSRTLDALSKKSGALFVVSAGNCEGKNQIAAPGAAARALTVANLMRNGELEETSCHGPRADRATKPDISAPGTDIVAPLAAGADIGSPVGQYYTSLTGTSMASPHVAGTAALLAQQHKDWNATRLKARLISTADPLPKGPVDNEGAGRVDADQATDNSVTVDTGELEFGTTLWPHPTPKPVSRALTYQNSTKTAVTLKLTTPLDAGDTAKPPRLSATQVVVPAGGNASVTVTTDPGEGKVGRHTGRVIATPATGDPLVTTYGWFLEPEMYDVTVRGYYSNGKPADGELLFVTRPDGGPVDTFDGLGGPEMFNGIAKMRIAPGTYSVSSTFFQPATDSAPDTFTVVALPQVKVAKTTQLTLDARKAVDAGVSLDSRVQPPAGRTTLAYYRLDRFGKLSGFEEVSSSGGPVRTLAVPTGPVSIGKLEFSAGTRLETPAYKLFLGRASLPVGELPGGPRVAGSKQLVVVKELAHAAGKLALIAADPEDADLDALALEAQQAKAAGVLFYNPSEPGLSTNPTALTTTGVKIPVLRTSRAVADLLAKKPGQVVRLDGTISSPIVYDLLKAWPDRIPADPRYAAKVAELARIQETYGAQTKATRLAETRVGYTPLGEAHGLDTRPLGVGPVNRIAYVTAGEWEQRIESAEGDNSAFWRSGVHRYRAGESQSIRWGSPVINSGLPAKTSKWPSDAGVKRTGGNLVIGLAGFTQGSDHYEEPGGIPDGTYAVALQRDGKTLVKADELVINGPVPEAPGSYRLTLDARRTWTKYSPRVQSIWDFRSRGGAAEAMPLVLADLNLPQANAFGQVRVGTAVKVTLNLRQQTGAPTAAFTRVRVWQSYDGKTWTPVLVTKTPTGSYVATSNHPVAHAGGTVDLRLDATDAAGGRLQQTITKAYGLTR